MCTHAAYFRRYGFDLYKAACKSVADFLHAPCSDVVIVTNATTAVMAVVNSLGLAAGDAVLVTSSTYNACRLVVNAYCERTGVQVSAAF